MFPANLLLCLQVKEVKLQRVITHSLWWSHCRMGVCVGGTFGGASGILVKFFCFQSSCLSTTCGTHFPKYLPCSCWCFFKVVFFFDCASKNWLGYMLKTSARLIYRKGKGPGNRLSQHIRKKGQFSLQFLLISECQINRGGRKEKVFRCFSTGAGFTFILVQNIFMHIQKLR